VEDPDHDFDLDRHFYIGNVKPFNFFSEKCAKDRRVPYLKDIPVGNIEHFFKCWLETLTS
jgi:hypothetical protein